MLHEIHSIKSFQIIAPHTLEVIFENNATRKINFSPVLYGEMYGPLQDLNLFNCVQIDDEVNTLVWPNGADFDPETLYNWEQHIEELSMRAKEWKA